MAQFLFGGGWNRRAHGCEEVLCGEERPVCLGDGWNLAMGGVEFSCAGDAVAAGGGDEEDLVAVVLPCGADVVAVGPMG